MRELFVVNHESTETSLVLRTEDGEEFFLDLAGLEGSVRSILGFGTPPAASATDADASPLAAVHTPDSPAAEATGADSAESLASAESTASAASAASAEHPAATGTGAATPAATTLSAVGNSALASGSATPSRPLTDRLSMRPPEIQHRVRAGASVAELAAEMNVPESRVEPFAHPVLMERARIAEIAKQAHPVREDGPAKLTIFEVLATAFAARGHSLSEATWDAFREKGQPWTIRVSWKAGLSENEAEWTLKQSLGTPDTLVARNTVAADLTDPDFVQPVRSLTSLGRGSRRVEAIDAREDRDGDDFEREPYDEYEETVLGLTPEHAAASDTAEAAAPGSVDDLSSARQRKHRRSAAEATDADAPAAADAETTAAEAGTPTAGATDADAEDDFFQNPDPQPKPAKRRRKAVTPHWEDVLLGVRANTKRPRE